jgi:hypothetical protein
MNAKIFNTTLKQLTLSFNSFSIVSHEGQLLGSQDMTTQYLTTTRLVAFQIVKKYLNPHVGDLFILNDPENGGFGLTQIIFVAALSENLFIIWDQELSLIDFKIPPTPLFEKNKINAFVWTALVESHPQANRLKEFFETAKAQLDLVMSQKDLIQTLSTTKNQVQWLKASQEMFEHQFSSKALGSAESTYKFKNNQLVKLKLSIEEKQNVRLITLDFTHTSPATDYFAASHVVESGLIQKMIQFYQIEDYFSQVVLDKIKIILPPKSIVSKAHSSGEYNLEIQSICQQLFTFNLSQMNSQTRKINSVFELAPELKFDFLSNLIRVPLHLDQKIAALDQLQILLNSGQLKALHLSRHDSVLKIQLLVQGSETLQIKVKSFLLTESKDFSFKINHKSLTERMVALKENDIVDLEWKIS